MVDLNFRSWLVKFKPFLFSSKTICITYPNMLRSAFSLGRISAPQRALAFRSYATKSNEGMEDLYRATREGDLEKAEQLANSMTQDKFFPV